jgi:hypothetical protein
VDVRVLVIGEVRGYASSMGHAMGCIEGRGVGWCEMKKKRMRKRRKKKSEAWSRYENG